LIIQFLTIYIVNWILLLLCCDSVLEGLDTVNAYNWFMWTIDWNWTCHNLIFPLHRSFNRISGFFNLTLRYLLTIKLNGKLWCVCGYSRSDATSPKTLLLAVQILSRLTIMDHVIAFRIWSFNFVWICFDLCRNNTVRFVCNVVHSFLNVLKLLLVV